MKFFLQFGGQGSFWFKEFIRYYPEPKMAKAYNIILEVFEEELTGIDSFRNYYDQFNPGGWLNDPSSFPGETFSSRTIISMPMIQAVQLLHLEFLRINGFNLNQILENSIGASGHSQGLVSAVMAALGFEGDEYYEAYRNCLRFLLFLPLRSQEAFPQVLPSPEETQMSDHLENEEPEPMAAVLGEDHGSTEKAVEEINASLTLSDKIYISLYNTPTNRILSGERRSLIQFNQKIFSQIKEKKLRYVYIKTSVPYHSPLIEAAVEAFKKDLKRIPFPYSGRDLKIPVYSFFDGRNMQNDIDLGVELCKEIMIRPLYWRKSLSVLKNNKVDAILDFGPGKISQRLSKDVLTSMNVDIPVVGMYNPNEQKKFFRKKF